MTELNPLEVLVQIRRDELEHLTGNRPVIDLSQKAVRISRAIDRLEPGTYTIQLVKPAAMGELGTWQVEIKTTTAIRAMEL